MNYKNSKSDTAKLLTIIPRDTVTVSDYERQLKNSFGKVEPIMNKKTRAFPVDAMPIRCREMITALSESLQVSVDMVASAMLGVLSVACNQNSIRYKAGWKAEPLALYMVGIAEAGEKKSPVLNALKEPVDEWERYVNMKRKPQIAVSEQKLKNLKSQLARAEKALEKGKGDEAETLRLAQEIENFEPVKRVRVYGGDVTSEKLARLLDENGERFSIVSSEGGVFQVMAGDRYGNGVANYDIYCQAFFGEKVDIDRVHSGTVSMYHPVLSMVLFVQPVIANKLLNNETLRGVGLVDRCLFYKPCSSIGKGRFYAEPVPAQVESEYNNMVRSLLDDSRHRELKLSKDAKKVFGEWYEEFERSMKERFDGLLGWASKHRGIVGRIAGILQLAEDGSEVVRGDIMEDAIRIGEYFQEQALMILREDGLSRAEEHALYIVDRIKHSRDKLKRDVLGRVYIEYSDLRRAINRSGLKTKDDFQEPLQVLGDKNYIKIGEDGRKIYVNSEVLQ